MSAFEESPAKKARTASISALEQKCINAVRVLSADIVEKAKSGHPGAPMGCAPIAHALFDKFMKFSPQNPKWHDRDRFILSNGHGCALLYSMLHLTGYDLSIEDLKQFRQLNSKTPGHPENVITPGVEVSTGPLGQGISNAVGVAMAEKNLAATYNKEGFTVVDHYTYVICGDGCLQEGVSSEASSLAGHLGLGKLIVCYDDNKITIDGSTELSFTEDVGKRYEAYGWQVLTVADVNAVGSMEAALSEARADTARPTIIKVRTVIGEGSGKAGTHGVHGAPLGAADLAATKTKFGFNPDESFSVPGDVAAHYGSKRETGAAQEAQWNALFAEYAKAHPELAAEFTRRMEGVQLPDGWKNKLPKFDPAEAKSVATRQRSEQVLNAIAGAIPEVIGGSADLTPSTLTALKCSGDFQAATPAGRYIRFGVREHAMVAICNGIYAHGGFRPFCATFLNFIGYALGAVRVAALSHFGVMFVMTHDSIGLGEDGPTHQPVEMLESLRAMPHLITLRPADGNEVAGAYALAMERSRTPCVISLSRQGVPTLPGTSIENVAKGGYILKDFGAVAAGLKNPTIILVATGTEVSLAMDAAEELMKQSTEAASQTAHPVPIWVRVVSMPSTEIFDEQPIEYRRKVLVPGAPIVSVEAGGVRGWKQYAHAHCGVDYQFGLSAPGGKIYEYFGLTPAAVAADAQAVISYYTPKGSAYPTAPSVLDFPELPKRGTHH